MGRLIDCDKLCTDLLERWNIADKNREDQIRWLMADVVTPIVACQPTVDAVEVVRCKDCRWRDDQSGSTAWMPCRALMTPNDFYCPRGERKDGATMDKLNEVIANTAYILDCLRNLKSIYETGDCNNCEIEVTCKFKPAPGQMVRYNCPFYVKEGEQA